MPARGAVLKVTTVTGRGVLEFAVWKPFFLSELSWRAYTVSGSRVFTLSSNTLGLFQGAELSPAGGGNWPAPGSHTVQEFIFMFSSK